MEAGLQQIDGNINLNHGEILQREEDQSDSGTDLELCELVQTNEPIDDKVDFCLAPLHKKSEIVKKQAEISYNNMNEHLKKRDLKYLGKMGHPSNL